MTIEELKERVPNVVADEWRQHPNGLGWVKNTASAESSSWIEGVVSGNARVSGDAWDRSPLQIQGTRHFCNSWSATELAIGCHHYTYAWWLDNYEKVGKSEGYSRAEILEYGEYIKLFCAIANLRKPGDFPIARPAGKL
jgi:hypothetical protein